jgi:hypothetical protein
MKLNLCIFFGISLLLVPTTFGQVWAVDYRHPLTLGMNVPRSPAVELGSSTHKGRGDLEIFIHYLFIQNLFPASASGAMMKKIFASRIGKRSQEDRAYNLQALGVFGSWRGL